MRLTGFLRSSYSCELAASSGYSKPCCQGTNYFLAARITCVLHSGDYAEVTRVTNVRKGGGPTELIGK